MQGWRLRFLKIADYPDDPAHQLKPCRMGRDVFPRAFMLMDTNRVTVIGGLDVTDLVFALLSHQYRTLDGP
jgi:hypothetical protein